MYKKFYTRKKSSKGKWGIIILGSITGFINGFFGGGGGMIVVPLLCYILKFSDKSAHATAILIILPLCLISALIYIFNGEYAIMPTVWTGIGFLAGGILGALLLKKISNKLIRVIFSLLMIGAGIKMIF